MTGAAATAAYVALVVVAAGLPVGMWTRTTGPRRGDEQILTRLAPVPIANDEQSPHYCYTCRRICGSQPHPPQ
ncbi:hypothetical protein [Streptomyces sp. NBC_01237]|uniref:hypothetical protein n=1 Tax=Streptomyces sp. NBC_01237 TaxID=2903790 RepID=UPI002DDC199E|nr:hypothetical protein [Streptomyces sp. NBC_01237]WRZ73798.1 hypothetical protein OG251_20370 [Streptomyces sp. NBC_01237]